jgi:ABC-2 type transport system ATP-binding protein
MIVESEGAVEANLVRLEEVTKRFGDVVAVDRVTLNVRQGEVFGLLGPNGAGKTTLINILVGLLRVDAGRAFIRDREVGRTRFEGRRNTGIVPQELAIYEDLTSLENVKFFASLYGLRGRELDKAAREALELSGLADKAKGIPKRFSGGMKRRLNIACAIAHRPKLIIMDEPTVGIDPQSRHHILQSVRRLNRDPEEPNRLRQIPGVKAVEVTDGVVKVTSAREVNTLGPVISHFAGRGIPIRAIETKTPDLETVFLSLTGRSLRD